MTTVLNVLPTYTISMARIEGAKSNFNRPKKIPLFVIQALGAGGAVTNAAVNTAIAADIAATKAALELVEDDVGLANVDNTPDALKPVSADQAAADALRELLSNKVTAFAAPTDDQYPSAKLVNDSLALRELLSNKVTAFAAPTDAQYPSAKLVNDSLTALSGSVTTQLASKADLVGGVIPTAQLPAIAVVDFLGNVANEAAMLALVGQKGDWCIRNDEGQVYIIIGANPAVIGGWQAIEYPAAPVTTVNGQAGTVVLGKADIGLGNADNTSDVNKPVSTAQAAADALRELLSNKVTAFAAPTDDQYPSAKLVNDSLALYALKASPVFTGAMSISGQSLTGSQATSLFSGTAVWNTTGTPNLLYFDVTDTASNSLSNLLSLNVGGSFRYLFNKDGSARALASFRAGTNAVNVGFTSGMLGLGSTHELRWAQDGNGLSGTSGLSLFRDANDVLTQRRGVNPQAHYLMNTYTDAANNEFGGLRWVTNRFELVTDKIGSGSYRDLWILAGNPAGHRLQVSGSIIRNYYGGIVDARAGMNLDGNFNVFGAAGAKLCVSSGTSSMTGQAIIEMTTNSNTVTTQIIRPNVKDGNGGYTGAGHHLQVHAGKGAAGNNNGGDLIFNGGDPTGTGVRGSVRFNNLPTSSAGLTSGAIWNNGGVINII